MKVFIKQMTSLTWLGKQQKPSGIKNPGICRVFLFCRLIRDFAVAVKATAKCVGLFDKHPGNPDLERICENFQFKH